MSFNFCVHMILDKHLTEVENTPNDYDIPPESIFIPMAATFPLDSKFKEGKVKLLLSVTLLTVSL